jgi:hypothetical protein
VRLLNDGELASLPPLARLEPADEWGGEALAELAASGELGGVPVVRDGDDIVVLGRQIVHAHILAKTPSLDGLYIDATDDEVEALQAAEAAGTGHLAEAVVQLLEVEPVDDTGGRPRTVGQAYELVAAVRGVAADSVATARSRLRSARTRAPGGGLDLLGLEDDREWATPIEALQRLLQGAVTGMSTVRGRLTKAIGSGECPAQKVEDIRGRLDELIADAKRLVPQSVCPACKAVEAYIEDCATCLGAGWVGPLEDDALPDELYVQDGVTRVLSGGEVVELEDDEEEGMDLGW